MDLLLYLVAHRDRVVDKEEIFDAVWAGAAVEEVALPRCVSEIRRALGDDAREPRYIRTVPKRGYRLVAEVRSPAARGGRWRRSRRTWPAPALASAVLAAFGLYFIVLALEPGREAASGPRALSVGADDRRPRLAFVLSPRAAPGDGTEPLRALLPDLLAVELELCEEVQVVRSALASDDGAGALDLRRKRRSDPGVELLAELALVRSSAREIEVRARLVDRTTDETLAELAETVPTDHLPDAVALLAAGLCHGSSAFGGRAPAGFSGSAALPRKPAARRLYLEGLRRLRRLEGGSARELLERSLAEEPGRPHVHRALAEAWWTLGHREKAAAAAEKALELAAGLPREERLWLRAYRLEVSSRPAEAADQYRLVRRLAPERFDYGFHLAAVEARAGRAEAARDVLDDLRRRLGTRYRDPRLDLLESRIDTQLGDYPGALTSAHRAGELAGETGADLMLAHARLGEAQALDRLGRTREARTALSASRLLFAAAGDRLNEARAARTLAGWQAAAGDFEAARATYRETLAVYLELADRWGEAEVWLGLGTLAADTGGAQSETQLTRAAETFRAVGAVGGEAEAIDRLGRMHAIRGDYGAAEPLLERALALRRSAGDRLGTGLGLLNLGKLALLQGRLAEARERLGRSREVLDGLDAQRWLGAVSFNLGYVESLSGNPARADAAFAEAVAHHRSTDNTRMLAASLRGRGEVLTQQARFDEAERAVDEALELHLEIGEPGRIAESRCTRVDLLLAEGRLEAAHRESVRAVSATPPGTLDRAKALRHLAEAALARGAIDEATQALEEMLDFWGSSAETGINRYPTLITAARVEAAEGRRDRARSRLAELIPEIEARGAWSLAAEARLVSGEIALAAGNRTDALDLLHEVERDATARGLTWIAQRARRATAAAEALSRPARRPA